MEALDEILALTEAVEQRVERGDWAEASALDAERCRLLAALFADPASTADLAACREALQQLLLRNQRTIERVEAESRQIAQSFADAGRVAGAMRDYQRNTGPGNLVYLRDAMVNDR